MVELDTVLTVAIGRNMTNGSPMPDEWWKAMRREVRTVLATYGTVVCEADSVSAIGSDGANHGADEESTVFVTINVSDVGAVRRAIGEILHGYSSTTACFAYDAQHEPCFGTTDGFRPALPVESDVVAEFRRLESMVAEFRRKVR